MAMTIHRQGLQAIEAVEFEGKLVLELGWMLAY